MNDTTLDLLQEGTHAKGDDMPFAPALVGGPAPFLSAPPSMARLRQVKFAYTTRRIFDRPIGGLLVGDLRPRPGEGWRSRPLRAPSRPDSRPGLGEIMGGAGQVDEPPPRARVRGKGTSVHASCAFEPVRSLGVGLRAFPQVLVALDVVHPPHQRERLSKPAVEILRDEVERRVAEAVGKGEIEIREGVPVGTRGRSPAERSLRAEEHESVDA